MRSLTQFLCSALCTAVLLVSCMSAEVSIREDHTAQVSFEVFDDLDSSDDMEIDSLMLGYDEHRDNNELLELIIPFFDSPLISDLVLDTLEGSIKGQYTISTIDSLGRFLDPMFGNPYEVSYTGSQFTLKGSDGDANPADDICGCTHLIGVRLLLTFEQEIRSFETPNPFISQVDKHSILIDTSLGEMAYSEKPNELLVRLK